MWNVKSLASDNLATKQNKWKRNLERDGRCNICGMADENGFLLWRNVQMPGPCEIRCEGWGSLGGKGFQIQSVSDPPRQNQTEVAWFGPFSLLAWLVPTK